MRHLLTNVFLILCLAFFSFNATAQRTSDPNTIGWYNIYGTYNINKKASIWLEYVFRRENVITSWQQSMVRGGFQYKFGPGFQASLLYAHIMTFEYGDLPPGPHWIPEHRITEQISWGDTKGIVSFSHRLRLEQRFLGKIDQKASERNVSDWLLLNRVRYMLRADVPLNKKSMTDKTVYAAAFDEVFVGFGKNVNRNVFDQNRIGIVVGYKFNKTFRAEAGYINQILQQGGAVNGNSVFQYNNGPLLSAYFTLN